MNRVNFIAATGATAGVASVRPIPALPKDYNYLLQTDDAMKWANAYIELFGGDRMLMYAWFANAIETGRAFGDRKARENKSVSEEE